LETFDRNRADRVARPVEIAPMHHPDKRRRWGGWLLGLAVLLVLSGGVALGGWRYVSRHSAALAASEQRRDLVPSLRLAAVRASADDVVVSLPATTSAF
jgi:hypothetical protein